ncbi:hypothetical protein D3C79_708470 [compost metagenome]
MHQVIGAAQVGGIEIQVAAQPFQRADLTENLHLSLAEGCGAFFAANGCSSMRGHQLDQVVDFTEVACSHRLRPGTEQADCAHAGHCQQGFSDPGNGQHQGIVLLGDCQHGHHHGGKAAEHEGMRTGIAQQGAARGAQGQPQR